VVSLPHGNKLARVSEKLKLSAEEETAIRDKAEHMPGCGLLKSGVDMIAESLDFLGEGTDGRWLTEDSVLYEEAVGIVKDRGLKNVSPELYADKDVSLDLLFDVRKRLSDITADRVYLPSGGEIVISPTEAMYVVDVNTFKMTSGKDREQTFLKTNLEAAEVLAWQIAARNMAGIIIVDMINMKADENVTILLEKMKEYLKGTNPQAQVADVTKLGLIEITRKRKGLSIYEIRHILDSTILI
jgi:ribonuclease G